MVRASNSIHVFPVTIPAGTPASAPQVTPLTFPAGPVVSVEFLVPPGPRGCVGFSLGSGGTQVIPYETGTWLVYNDTEKEWKLTDHVDSGSWQLFAYNIGTYPHTITVTFHVDPPPDGDDGQGFRPLSVAAIRWAGSTT
jgi:hypothetical protein